MSPDGYMKDKFSEPRSFLALYNAYFPPCPSPQPPAISQIQIKLLKKSQVLKILSPSKKFDHSLCPSLMSFSLKRSDEGLKNKIDDRFLSRRQVIVSLRGVIYLDVRCSLLRTDLHTGQRKLAFWSPLKHNVCNHEEFSPHIVGTDAVVSSWGL